MGWAAAVIALAVGCAQRSAPRLCGRVVDEAGLPVAGALVRGSSGRGATTDATGRFCLARREDAVSAEARGFCAAGPLVAAEGWLTIRLLRALTATSVYQAGFGARVALRARLACPPPTPAVFRWEQIDGPPLGDRATGWNTDTLVFRTHPLGARTTRPDVLALSPAEAGRYVFRVTARAGVEEWSAEAEATAASVANGLLSVPVEHDAYLDSGAGRPPGRWELLAAPPGSLATLADVPTVDGSGGVVRLRIDRPGFYEVREARSGVRLVFEAGLWNAVPRDCDRPECHPGEQAAWAATRHARALDAHLERPTPEPFEERCLACHTVGWDPGSRAEGFDDVAAALGVRVRDGWPGGAAALPRDLRRLANVWCIACHGSGRLPEHGKRPMTVRVGVCAQCHDAPPKYPRVAEWRESKMSAPVTDAARAGDRCAGCHTAQGAVTRMRGRTVTAVSAEVAEPVTCAVCHVAHTPAPGLLRRTGTVSTVSGVLFEAGKGAVCLGCHQANVRADVAAEAGRLLPEAPQAEVLFGRGAYFAADGQPGVLPPNLCVDCHMARCAECHQDEERRRGGHTFRPMPVTGPAPEDCDGDGRVAPLAEEVAACLALVEEAVLRRLAALPGCAGARPGRDGERIVPVGAGGERLPQCEAAWMGVGGAEIYRAAHDLLLIARDGSGGAHNPGFAIRVLRGVLRAGEGEAGATSSGNRR